ncbi:hypothetical protein SD10_23535 [Spirosoma radiotolerans]|uniref:Uncharacterized protein n=1 Tax=Spirosoma radiotolerans TaxID=1379870 RepID=A0A0E3V972_9BACT|nr:hypothetical protein SD10_23535 [Spirosoma radiotolerans]
MLTLKLLDSPLLVLGDSMYGYSINMILFFFLPLPKDNPARFHCLYIVAELGIIAYHKSTNATTLRKVKFDSFNLFSKYACQNQMTGIL